MFKKFILPAIGVVLMVFAIYHVVRAQQTPPKTDPLVAPASSPFQKSIAGAGMVEPESENIALGAQLPGVIAEVQVRVGAAVEKGTLLFRLDDRHVRAELRVREANLLKAQLEQARLNGMPRDEERRAAAAQVRDAEAHKIEAEDHYLRLKNKVGDTAYSAAEFIQRKQAFHIAEAKLERARAEFDLVVNGAWVYDKKVADAAVRQSEALLEQTRAELTRLEVRAPIAGEILQVNVRPGEFVGTPASQPFVVVGGSRRHVRVDVDENDIARFREGLPARAKRRGDATTEIPLRFVRIEPLVIPKKSLVGGTTERVDTRVLQVIYAVESTTVPLYVGQQVDVFLDASK